MALTTYTPAEQERLLRNHMRRGSHRALAMMNRKQFEVEQLMLERVLTVGLAEYDGDRSWHYSVERLKVEALEEAADLVFYETLINLKDRGLIP